MRSLAKGVRVVPAVKDGKPAGFKALELYTQLRDGKRFVIGLERRGKPAAIELMIR
jgi:hypothetical protein